MKEYTLEQVNDKLATAVRGFSASDWSPVLKSLKILAVSDHKKRFAMGVGPDGTPWRPLAHGRIGTPSPLPLQDTGQLMASINARTTSNEVIVGTSMQYAGVHQFGAVIRPVRAKFLAIPITLEARRAGSPRNFKVNGHGLKVRIGKSKQGGILYDDSGAKTTIHYILAKSVTIPARPFIGFSQDFMKKTELVVIDAWQKKTGSIWQ
jgi:phage virion morphogenesis protein